MGIKEPEPSAMLQLPTIEIFCIYQHNPTDEDLMKKLKAHLAPLKRRRLVTLWQEIQAGQDWQEEFEQHLNSAHIILLLISPDFMYSNRCYTAMEQALERQNKQETRVIPIILRHIAWKGTLIEKLQALPTGGKPVTDRRSWTSDDEALNDVVEQISPVVTKLLLPLYVETASQLTQNRQQEDALVIYNRALELNPEYVPALSGKGDALFALEQHEEGLIAYDAVLKLAPDAADVFLHARRASALRKQGRYEESLAAYDAAIQLDPMSFLYEDKAELLLQLKQYQEAIEVYDLLIKIAQDDDDQIRAAQYSMQKGDILLKAYRYEEALLAYDEAIQLDYSQMPDYSYKKGELALRLRRYEEAAKALRSAIFHDAVMYQDYSPQKTLYLEHLALALLKTEHYQEALNANEQCIKQRSEAHPEDYHGKGLALFGLNRYEEALNAFDEAIRLSDSEINPQFYHDKAASHEKLAKQLYGLEEQTRASWNYKKSESIAFIPPVLPNEFTLLRTFQPDSGRILSAIFSPDGQMIASNIDNRIVQLWSPHTGQPLRTITDNFNPIYSFAFSPEGYLLTCGIPDTSIKLWNPQTGELLRSSGIHLSLSPFYNAVLSSDGRLIAGNTNDNTVYVWNIENEKLLSSFSASEDNPNPILSMTFSSDGCLLATGHKFKVIKLWNPFTGQEIRRLHGHAHAISHLAFSPDGRLLASGSRDKTVKLWNPFTGQELHTLGGYFGPITTIAFSPDGQFLVTGSEDQRILFWNPQTGQQLYSLPLTSSQNLTFSPDGYLLANRTTDGTIEIRGKK